MPRSRRPAGEHRLREARERALTLLYEAELKTITPSDAMDAQIVDIEPLTRLLMEGVEQDGVRFDELIAAHSKGWTLDRMPRIDRTIMRMALAEFERSPETSKAIIIDEAVRLAKRYSTDDSGKFVNGMLSAMAPKVRAEP